MPKILLLVALMAQSLPVVAMAQQPATSVRVSYADLDLSTDAGRKSLDRRLHRAAASVCPDDNGVRDIGRLVAIRDCQAKAMERVSAPRAEALAAAGSRTMAAARH